MHRTYATMKVVRHGIVAIESVISSACQAAVQRANSPVFPQTLAPVGLRAYFVNAWASDGYVRRSLILIYNGLRRSVFIVKHLYGPRALLTSQLL